MVHEGRVIQMTHMAIRARELEGDGIRINEYYRGDYIGFEIVKTVVGVTIVYGMLLALYAVFHFNTILQDFYERSSIEDFRKYLLWYLVIVLVSVMVSYIVYSVRYSRTRKKIRAYYNELKKLERSYRKTETV